MKKNLRIVSAAAAALLAVAPIAVSGVADAAVTVNNATASQPAQTTAGTVTINASLNATAGKTSVADAEKSISISVDGATIANKRGTGNGDYSVRIVKADNSPVTGNLEANQAYKIVVTGLKLNGLTTGNHYAIAGGTVNVGNHTNATASELNGAVNFTSDSFYVFDKSLTGTPVVTEGTKVVSSGSVDLGNITNVTSLANEITNKYKVNMPSGNAQALDWSASSVEDAVRAGLKAANVAVDRNNNFKTPATSFKVTLTGYASNGKTVEFPVTVNVKSAAAQNNAPVFSTTMSNGQTYSNVKKVNDTTWNVSLAQNAAVNAQTIASTFTAKINGSSQLTTDVKVDSSNLNTSVAGKYTVVLSATNPAGKTTKATVNVTVGNPGETKTVQAGSETAKVVTIDGNKVSETNNTLANDAKVATFGTVVVNGVSYTRLNSANSNEFVETKYVDGSIKEETTKSTKIMYKSAVYTMDKDKKMSNSGKTIAGYTDTDLVVDGNGNLKVYTASNGDTFYKLSKNQGYVRARNVTGSKMTLKKNSYVYKSNGKRASKKLLKKGSTITVYGGQYKAIRRYHKKAVRVGVNRYVKVVNVNYELTK